MHNYLKKIYDTLIVSLETINILLDNTPDMEIITNYQNDIMNIIYLIISNLDPNTEVISKIKNAINDYWQDENPVDQLKLYGKTSREILYAIKSYTDKFTISVPDETPRSILNNASTSITLKPNEHIHINKTETKLF